MKKLLLAMILLAPAAQGAEFLVRASDNPDDDGYKRGDLVVAMPDWHPWGGEEWANFYIVKVADLSLETAQQYCVSAAASRRLWWLDTAALSNANRTTLLNTGTLTITWNNLHSAVKNKETGQGAP